MKSVLRCLVVLLVGLESVGIANAGPHEGGVLIFHAAWYNGRLGSDLCELDYPDHCEDAVVNVPWGDLWTWSVLAAFPEGSSPRLMRVSFGVDYDERDLDMDDWEFCGFLETPQPGWPAPGSGTTVEWQSPQTDHLVRVGAFLAFTYSGSDTPFCLVPHPTEGGWFSDDSTPPVQDPIADYACLGFGVDPGYLPCPVSGEVGACCLPDGSCQVMTEGACAGEEGIWQGGGSDCDPDPCAVPTLDESWGTLKRRFH
jgi:hypothetical protein